MDCSIIVSALASFAVSAVLGKFIIPFLKKEKVGNTEREELKEHQKKTGTPSMGGVIFLAAALIVSLFYMRSYPKIIPVLFVTLGFGIIGFIDDHIKSKKHRSDGLYPKQKMLLEIAVTAAFAVYLILSETSLEMIIPFGGGRCLDLGWLAVVILFPAVIGTVNGVNFTDGLDGLATSVTLPVAMFFAVVSLLTGAGIEPLCGAIFGALLGFLLYNVYPAKVFMGDTGSLALGGFVASSAYMMQLPIFILIIGFIYWIEILSVMIQVTYFKKTGGKRIFRMAPIHHHFELGGWSETKVVDVFSTVTVLLCLAAFAALAGVL